jgi:hypothetical protein
MCYYRLCIFLGCGHSTFSETPVGFCKDASEKHAERGQQSQRVSTLSTTSSVYSRTDSMEAEKHNPMPTSAIGRQIQPCTEVRVHPLQTRRLERMCAICQDERDRRLEALHSLNKERRFEPWRWQFKYQGGSTSVQQNDAVGVPTNAGWDVTTTLNSIVAGSSGWMKDWKRQDSDMVG